MSDLSSKFLQFIEALERQGVVTQEQANGLRQEIVSFVQDEERYFAALATYEREKPWWKKVLP